MQMYLFVLHIWSFAYNFNKNRGIKNLMYTFYILRMTFFCHKINSQFLVDRVSVPSPIVLDVLMDTMARDRAHMYLFSV